MEHIVDDDKMIVYFGCGYPGALGIRKFMAKKFPNHKHAVLTYQDFEKLRDENPSNRDGSNRNR